MQDALNTIEESRENNQQEIQQLREKKVSYLIKKLRKDVLTTLKEIEEIAKDFETKL